MNNRPWMQIEVEDAHTLTTDEFLAKYPDRTANGLRFKRKKTRDRPRDITDGVLTVREPASEEDWEELWSSLETAGEARSDLAPTQETTEFTSADARPIGLCFLGDIHAGNSGVRYDLLKQDLELIRDTEGLYVCGMGDYIDNYKPQSKAGSGMYHSLFADPTEQLAYVTTRLRVATGKWLCLAQGNHDAWDARWAGIDRLPDLAQDLGTAYFSERGGTVFVNVGSMRYAIVVKHDYRGKSQINKSNSQRRVFDEFPEWTNADVICLAHLHEPLLEQVMRKGETVTYLRSGTYKTHDSYAEAGGYKPAYGVPLVILYPHERRIIAFHGESFRDGVRFLQQERLS